MATLELSEMKKIKSKMPQISSSESKDSDLCKAVKIPFRVIEISMSLLWRLEVQVIKSRNCVIPLCVRETLGSVGSQTQLCN